MQPPFLPKVRSRNAKSVIIFDKIWRISSLWVPSRSRAISSSAMVCTASPASSASSAFSNSESCTVSAKTPFICSRIQIPNSQNENPKRIRPLLKIVLAKKNRVRPSDASRSGCRASQGTTGDFLKMNFEQRPSIRISGRHTPERAAQTRPFPSSSPDDCRSSGDVHFPYGVAAYLFLKNHPYFENFRFAF